VSEQTAIAKATEALLSQGAAELSAQAAKTSELAAAQSALDLESAVAAAAVSADVAGQKLAAIGDSLELAQTEASHAATSAQLASDMAAAASSSEVNAGQSAAAAAQSLLDTNASRDAASLSEANAKTSETNAKASEDSSKLSETNAIDAEQAAFASQTAAATSEQNAGQSAAGAASSLAQAQAIIRTMNQLYLGSKVADPVTDNNGDPLIVGAEYFNSTTNQIRVYTATGWQDQDLTAETMAANATASAAAAAGSAQAALDSKNAAALSETHSKTSETNSKTSEDNATARAAAALQSANDSAASAQAAADSKTAAAASEGNAQTYRNQAQQYAANAALYGPIGQCRFVYVSSTQCQLQRHNGQFLMINGVAQTIPAAGVNLSNAGMVAATLYYVYAYMNAGNMALEGSTTAHVADATTGIRVKSGDATRTLVGMVYIGTGAIFRDDTTGNLHVASWFNRRRRSLALLVGTNMNFANTSIAAIGSGASILVWGGESLTVNHAVRLGNSTTGTLDVVQGMVNGAGAGTSAVYQAPSNNAQGDVFISGEFDTIGEGLALGRLGAYCTAGVGLIIVATEFLITNM
jgi:hypothetical protein